MCAFVVLCLVFPYQAKRLAWERLQKNDLLCVEWDVKPLLSQCMLCWLYYWQILVETLTLGAPLLLPPLHERMELLHLLLPHGPAGWDSLSHGQVVWS